MQMSKTQRQLFKIHNEGVSIRNLDIILLTLTVVGERKSSSIRTIQFCISYMILLVHIFRYSVIRFYLYEIRI